MINHKLQKPVVLTIAANDSAGMAGLAMDIKTQQAFNVHSLSVITATTAQNNSQLLGINPVDPLILQQQLDALADIDISVVKVGLLANLAQVKVVRKFILSRKLPLVLDPVFSASNGAEFFPKKDIGIYVDLLLPLCHLITPNLIEVELLTFLGVDDVQSIELAADSLLLLGAKNVLIKGGHRTAAGNIGTVSCEDFFAHEEKQFWLRSPRQLTHNTRGTGCAMASSITSCIAHHYSIEDAVVIGKMAINQGLAQAYSVSGDKGPVCISHFPDNYRHLPELIQSAQMLATNDESDLLNQTNLNQPRVIQYREFPACNELPIGLYPVVDSAAWVARLLPLGVTTIQLRIKQLKGELLRQEIQQAINIARQYDARLFINDYWQLAIQLGAYGVHLGQEDLDAADLQAIRSAGLRLGISSHCHYEVARASYWQPSYIAVGPVYHTHSKQMPWIPQGIEGLTYWRSVLKCPIVAIGGISLERVEAVKNCGVDGIAMISAITQADDPLSACRKLLVQVSSNHSDVLRPHEIS